MVAVVTVLTARITLRGWVRSLRGVLDGPTPLIDRPPVDDPQIAQVVSEIRQLLRDLDISRRTLSSTRVEESPGAQWSPEMLRRVLETELLGSEILVVSNREPYTHNRGEDGQIVVQRPASGLVTAFEAVMRACGGTWIAYGGGSADRETVDADDRIAVRQALQATPLGAYGSPMKRCSATIMAWPMRDCGRFAILRSPGQFFVSRTGRICRSESQVRGYRSGGSQAA